MNKYISKIMRYINTLDDIIQFIDVDGTTTNVPMNNIYTFIKGETVSFILIDHRDNAGYVVMTTLAKDVQLNGTVYSIDDYINGNATKDLFSSGGVKFVVVEELPEEGENGIIYLVPNDEDTYDEYIWIEDETRFEKLGSTDIDLSGYYTKEEVDDKIDDLQNDLDSNYYTETEVDDLLDDFYAKSEIDDAIENNELAISASLNDLNERIPDMNGYYNKKEIEEFLVQAATMIQQKQDILTFDTTPTSGSTNPVTSDGLYEAIGDIETALSQIIGSNP